METKTTPKATVTCIFCDTPNRVDLSRVHDRPRCGKCGKPVLLDRPVRVTDADLDRVVSGSDVPVLVDFYAEWCGPCKIMAPLLDDLARERAGQLLVAKLDTDRNPATAQRFAIRGVPTVIAFRGGAEVAREVGAVPRPRLEALVDGGRSG
jgi:thioredoxin 2